MLIMSISSHTAFFRYLNIHTAFGIGNADVRFLCSNNMRGVPRFFRLFNVTYNGIFFLIFERNPHRTLSLFERSYNVRNRLYEHRFLT